MVWLFLGAALLVASVIFGRAFAAADPKALAKVIRLGGPILLFVLSIVLTAGFSFAVGLPVLFLVLFWPLILKVFGPKIGLEGGAGDQFRQKRDGYERKSQSRSTMTTKEALAILGLDAGASREDVLRAHKTLMKKNHPDQGGSVYLAQKINEAKDVLIGSS